MTVRDLLTRSFRFAKILGADEPMGSGDATDALVILNEVIEQANIDKLLAYYQTTVIFNTITNQLSYTIGPASTSPNITAVRPVEILSGFSRRDNQDYPIFVASKEDYNYISQKSIGIAGWEQSVYYEAAWPKGTLYLYPKPTDANTSVHLSVMADIPAFASLDDVVTLPPGYTAWMKAKTGERLSTDYGTQFTLRMEKILMEAESSIKKNNIKPMPVARTGLAGLSGSGRYDVMSDMTGR
jgi:hypothetical protein